MSATHVHQQIYDLVEARRSRGELNRAQILRLKFLKLVEEVGEASAWLNTQLEAEIGDVGHQAGKLFRQREWLAKEWAGASSTAKELEEFKAEMVDIYVVLATIEREILLIEREDLGRVGAEFDLQAAALMKVAADVNRD